MNRKNSALRVAFLTDTAFQREDYLKSGMLKKRAIRKIQHEVHYPVVENSTAPDIVFKILRVPGGGWMLRKVGIRQERG